MRKNVFMFTIATNGYDITFADCLASQRRYAEQHGYHYFALTASPTTISGTVSAWLKIPMILTALKHGYDWVFFVDADCHINLHTPPIQSVAQPHQHIYFCHDRTNRINSGVIIVQNDHQSQQFFRRILLTADLPRGFLPKADQNLYENGHVIFFGKRCPAVAIIDPKWNNTTGQPMGEYIWHGGGRWIEKPRAQTSPSLTQSLISRLAEGSRYLQLRRLVRFYEQTYQF